MIVMSQSARTAFTLSRTNWRETTVLLVVAGLVPFLVHLVPWAGQRPLGVYLLPVFWTTFLAVYFRGASLGLLVGLVTPALNLALTGLPALPTTGSMALEVVLFVLVAALLVGRWPNFRLAAPAAWIVAKAAAITLQFFFPVLGDAGNPLQRLPRSTQNGLAGLAVLALINILLVAFYPKGDSWEKE
jgi:hypothetical protein